MRYYESATWYQLFRLGLLLWDCWRYTTKPILAARLELNRNLTETEPNRSIDSSHVASIGLCLVRFRFGTRRAANMGFASVSVLSTEPKLISEMILARY